MSSVCLTLLHEEADGLKVAVVGGTVERGLLGDSALLDVRAFFKQELRHRQVPVAGSKQKRRVAAVVRLRTWPGWRRGVE